MKKTILIAAVMFFAFSVAASAQALFQVGSTPVTTVASCGSTELTGDIVFTQVDGSPAIKTGTITVNYGVPITNTNTATVTVVDANGTPISGVASLNAITGTPNQLVLTLNPPATGTAPYTIRLSGVRVNVAGNPALTSLSANVSSTVNSFVGGQTNVVVISSIASAIASIDTITGSGPFAVNTALNINSVSTSGLGTVSLDVNEGFANAFVPNSIIGLTFSAIPAGLTVTLPVTVTTASTDTFQLSDADGVLATAPVVLSSASTNLSVFYKMVTATAAGSVATETLRIPVTVALAFGAPSPLPQGTVSVTADMFPKTKAFPFTNFSIVPQYTGTTCQKGPVTILTIVTGNTVLLIPYAVSASGFDTGIAIANTTKDPLSIFQTAIPQNGAITFTFFPQTGASFSYTTSATSPGAGLTAGILNAGGLYTVLLSQLVSAAGGPANFSGYIFAVVNATNAHGQYFISDFEAFTNGALMLVVDPTQRNAAPEKLEN